MLDSKTPWLGPSLLGIATSNSPARVSPQSIFYTVYESPLFLVDCGSGQVGRGVLETMLLAILLGYFLCL